MAGFSNRYPDLRSLNNSLLLIPGKGMPPWMQVKSEEGKKVIRKIVFITTSISLRPLVNKRFEKIQMSNIE